MSTSLLFDLAVVNAGRPAGALRDFAKQLCTVIHGERMLFVKDVHAIVMVSGSNNSVNPDGTLARGGHVEHIGEDRVCRERLIDIAKGVARGTLRFGRNGSGKCEAGYVKWAATQYREPCGPSALNHLDGRLALKGPYDRKASAGVSAMVETLERETEALADLKLRYDTSASALVVTEYEARPALYQLAGMLNDALATLDREDGSVGLWQFKAAWSQANICDQLRRSGRCNAAFDHRDVVAAA